MLEERLGQPRFGFDVLQEGETLSRNLTGSRWWFDLKWEHFQPPVAAGVYIDDAKPDVTAATPPSWGESSATAANICLQRPVRVAIHASKMLPDSQCAP